MTELAGDGCRICQRAKPESEVDAFADEVVPGVAHRETEAQVRMLRKEVR
jgi:hypothetical protein